MAWKLVNLRNGNAHWVDEEAANFYLDKAISLSNWRDTTSPVYAVDRQDFAQQIQAVQDAWVALGTAFRAMDLPPNLSPTYISALADGYGFNAADIPHQNLDVPGLVSIVASAGGWITKAAAAVVVSGYPTSQRDYTARSLSDGKSSYVVRMWLTNQGNVKYNCTGDPNNSSACLMPDGKSYTSDPYFSSRGLSIDSTDCKNASDWKCVSWINLRIIFPALIWSLDLCRAIATSLKSATPFEAVDMATKTGFAAPTIFGQRTTPPAVTFDVPDTQAARPTGPGFVRSLPQPNQLPHGQITVPTNNPTPTPRLPNLSPGSSAPTPATSPTQTPSLAPTTSTTTPSPTTGGSSAPMAYVNPTTRDLNTTCASWGTYGFLDRISIVNNVLNSNTSKYDPSAVGMVAAIQALDLECTSTSVPTGQLIVAAMGLTCAQWSALSDADQTAKIGTVIDRGPVAATVSKKLANDFCATQPSGSQGGSSGTPASSLQLPPTPAAALLVLGVSCPQWSVLSDTAKRELYRTKIIVPQNGFIPLDTFNQKISEINGYCMSMNVDMGNGSAGQGGGPKSTQPLPTTVQAVMDELGIGFAGGGCSIWAGWSAANKAANLKAVIFDPRGITATPAQIASLQNLVDGACVSASSSPNNLPTSGQAALSEMNLTCSQWSKLSADQKNSIYQSLIGARRGVTLSGSQLASSVGQVDQFCQAYNNAPPLTLGSMGFTCPQWMKLTQAEKGAAVNSAYTQQYKTSIDAASISRLVAQLDASCVATANGQGGGTSPGVGPGTTPGGINPVNQAGVGGGISTTTLLWLAGGGAVAWWLYQRSKG